MEPTPVPIRGDLILLGQLLKIIDIAETGGNAKEILAGGHVEVNGEPEDRRGRKLHPGDVVAIDSYRKWIIEGSDPAP